MTGQLVFSLVLYRHSIGDILPLLRSLASLAFDRLDYQVLLVIYDASPVGFPIPCITEIADALLGVRLLHQKGENIGFGSANNLNYKRAFLDDDDLFIVVNPDISFVPQELSPLLDWLQANSAHVSCVSPLIANESGDIQYSAKRNPTFLSLLLGRISLLRRLKFFARYDSWHKNLSHDYRGSCIDCSYLSGSFLVVPSFYYSRVGGFCESFFLHLEDADLVRRLSNVGRTLHNPIGRVTHLWARGSHRSVSQMILLARSYLVYCGIWGFSIA